MCTPMFLFAFFFFNDTATTEIYTLSLHDALPISDVRALQQNTLLQAGNLMMVHLGLLYAVIEAWGDRKSTRLNSSHLVISYAVFCLKKKKKKNIALANKQVRRQYRV